MEELAKRNLRNYGIFLGIMVLMTAALIFSILQARDSWKKGLAVEVQSVLDAHADGKYIVDKFVAVDSTISTSSAVYSLLRPGTNSKDKFYGVIVRVPSIVGPLPAVFVCSERDMDKPVFIGFAGDFGRVEDIIDFKNSSGIMNYWHDMVPKIMKKMNHDR